MERTLLIIKPDGVQRGLMGNIISRIESKGLKISAMKLEKISEEKAGKHYAEHRDKGFYPKLIDFITSSPCLLAVIEGENAISALRKMAGKTNPIDSEMGSIRGDFAMSVTKNIVHTSDGPESAVREIENFFDEKEVHGYTLCTEKWVYSH